MSGGQKNRFNNALDVKRVRSDGKSSSISDDLKQKSGQNSSAYDKYKASLYALFDNKVPLSKSAIEMGPDDAKPARRRTALSPQQALLEQIRKGTDPQEVKEAAAEIKKLGSSLPEDEEILVKVLGQDDPDLLMEALEKIEELLKTQPSRNPRLLRSRLDQASLATGSSKISAKCSAIKALII